MPKQIGILKIKGKLGDTSFYKSKDGYLVRDKGGIDGQRIKTDPRFKRTRENMSEFGRSTRDASKLRKLFAPMMEKIKDSNMHNRLVASIRACLNADVTNPRGERKLIDGDLSPLSGFEFNSGSTLSSTYFGPFAPVFDRVSGDGEIVIPAFEPEDYLLVPGSSTHFRFVMGVVEWDLEGTESVVAFQRSPYLPVGSAVASAISLQGQVTGNSTRPVLIGLGIEFAQEVNANNYALADSGYVSAQIVAVL